VQASAADRILAVRGKPALTFCFSSAFFARQGGQIRGEELCHHIFVLSRFFVRLLLTATQRKHAAMAAYIFC
jgi:hypothetical protein